MPVVLPSEERLSKADFVEDAIKGASRSRTCAMLT